MSVNRACSAARFSAYRGSPGSDLAAKLAVVAVKAKTTIRLATAAAQRQERLEAARLLSTVRRSTAVANVGEGATAGSEESNCSCA